MSEQPRRRRRQQMPNEELIIPAEEPQEVVVPKAEIIAPTIPRSFVNEAPKYDIHTRAGLLEYIKTAIELETDIATQEQILSLIRTDISRRKPVLNLKQAPSEPDIPIGSIWYDVFALSFMIPLLVLFTKGCFKGTEYGWGILLIICAPLWLITLICIIISVSRIYQTKSEKDDYKSNYQEYLVQKEQTQIDNETITKKYHVQYAQWEQSQNGIGYTTPHIDESRATLNKLYSLGYIYPKYRNLPALTSIYEYYMTGRCEELTGPHGAYNIYEDEMRKDTVISQLNTVIENLEQIKHNQYMLYEQVCSIQQNTAAIRSELAQIKGYTIQIAQLSALNAYYAARTERNTRILMYYHL